MKTRTCVLLLSLIYAPHIAASGDNEPDACEYALQLLVAKLEADGEFSFANKVDTLPDAESAYSTCLIPDDDVSAEDAIAYLVYRHTDNVTVYVLRSPLISSTLIRYGPFFSAYRK